MIKRPIQITTWKIIMVSWFDVSKNTLTIRSKWCIDETKQIMTFKQCLVESCHFVFGKSDMFTETRISGKARSAKSSAGKRLPSGQAPSHAAIDTVATVNVAQAVTPSGRSIATLSPSRGVDKDGPKVTSPRPPDTARSKMTSPHPPDTSRSKGTARQWTYKYHMLTIHAVLTLRSCAKILVMWSSGYNNTMDDLDTCDLLMTGEELKLWPHPWSLYYKLQGVRSPQ